MKAPELKHYLDFIGGRGLAGISFAIRLPSTGTTRGCRFSFYTGPLVDTISPTSGRMTVMSRSPLTGTVGDSSVGGTLGTALKKTGFDGIVITGRSRSLCGIEIVNGEVSIRDAAELKGATTGRSFDRLAGKGACAVIGPGRGKRRPLRQSHGRQAFSSGEKRDRPLLRGQEHQVRDSQGERKD